MTNPISHYHHVCWNCGRDVIGTGRLTYSCKECGCEQSPAAGPNKCGTFDPDFAAESNSPALGDPGQAR
jgi:hypothetical protein